MVAKVEVAVLAFIIIGGAVATFVIIVIITVAIAAGLHEPLAIAAQVEGAALAFVIVSGTMYQLWLSLLNVAAGPLEPLAMATMEAGTMEAGTITAVIIIGTCFIMDW